MGEVEAQPRSLSECRPWAEFFGPTALPSTFLEATAHMRKNFSHFCFNYCGIVSLSLAVSILRHPFTFLILLGLRAAWISLYVSRPADQPLVLFGRTFTDPETLVLLSGLSLSVVCLTRVVSILLSSVAIAVAVVCVHGALRIPEDRSMEPQQHNSLQPNNNG